MRAEHLYKRFGDKPVLEDVSLTVPEGAVVCLMAPSGWGKTTLLRCMAGLEKPDSGTVRDVPERIGYVFQEDRLCGHMSAVENVRLATGRRMDTETIRAHLTELGRFAIALGSLLDYEDVFLGAYSGDGAIVFDADKQVSAGVVGEGRNGASNFACVVDREFEVLSLVLAA